MFTLVHQLRLRDLVAQAPAFIGALVLAELFYKLGSFTLECVAFLATWYALEFASSVPARLGRRRRG